MSQMLSPSASHAWAAGAVIAGLVTWYLASNTNEAKARQAGAILGPGPKRAPLVGNVFNFPKARWYEVFSEWAQEYGDIIYVDLGGLPMVILNSLEAIRDLTEKRMNIHSGRPHFTLVCDMMGFGYSLSLMQPTRDYAEQRRLFQKAIGSHAVQEYDSFLRQGCSELLQRLDGFSGEPLSILIQTVGNVLTRIAYGEHFAQNHGPEIIQNNLDAVELVGWVSTKFWLVDVIPLLRYIPAWFPGAAFKRVGEQGKGYAHVLRYRSFDYVKAALAKGITDESIISKYMNEGGFSEGNLRDAVAVMYAAGVDTTAITITHFIFSITLYPEWQQQIHEEMHQVLGHGHMPTIEDIPKLKMLNAVFNESLRWNPAAPIGVPHVSAKEDVWRGYYIPKGCYLHCNIGFVLRDPRLWGEDSQDFNPRRFLREYNPSVDELPDIWSIPFGFGRRICPGRHLARRAALLYAAAILYSYEVLPYKGEVLTPNEPFEDSVVRRISHFRCTFKPRTE